MRIEGAWAVQNTSVRMFGAPGAKGSKASAKKAVLF
jgi:hypothetical protein